MIRAVNVGFQNQIVIIPWRKKPEEETDHYRDSQAQEGWYMLPQDPDDKLHRQISYRDQILLEFGMTSRQSTTIAIKAVQMIKGVEQVRVKRHLQWNEIADYQELFQDTYYTDGGYGNVIETPTQVDAYFDAIALANHEVIGETAVNMAQSVYQNLIMLSHVGQMIKRFFPDEYVYRLNHAFQDAVWHNDLQLANAMMKLGAQPFDVCYSSHDSYMMGSMISTLHHNDTRNLAYLLSKTPPGQYLEQLAQVVKEHISHVDERRRLSIRGLQMIARRGVKMEADTGERNLDWHYLREAYSSPQAPQLVQVLEKMDYPLNLDLVEHKLSECTELAKWMFESGRVPLKAKWINAILSKGSPGLIDWLIARPYAFTIHDISTMIERCLKGTPDRRDHPGSKLNLQLEQAIKLCPRYTPPKHEAEKLKAIGQKYQNDYLIYVATPVLIAEELTATE